MRICRVMPSYPTDLEPGIGLAGYQLLDHINELTLVITKRRPGAPKRIPRNVKLVRLPYPDVTIGDSTGLERAVRLALKMSAYLLFSLMSLPFMLRFRPDVVHVHSPLPIAHGLFAKYVMRKRFYLSFHGTDILGTQRSRSLRMLVKRADKVCYLSNAMRGMLGSFVPPERLLYTPNGVDTDLFRPGDGVRESTVCMVGSLRWQKDYPTALRAFASFQRKFPAWKLAIVGVGVQRDSLGELASELGIENTTVFLGTRSREDVAALMRTSSIFVLSSVTEGFPKVILEAAASGTPAVVTDVGNCREIVEGATGLVVPAQDSDALAAALGQLAGDHQESLRFSQQGPKAIAKYTWENTSAVLAESYSQSIA